MQHARTMARILQVNEDLVEAISFAHDLGHAPFGHGGEEELNKLMREYGGLIITCKVCESLISLNNAMLILKASIFVMKRERIS